MQRWLNCNKTSKIILVLYLVFYLDITFNHREAQARGSSVPQAERKQVTREQPFRPGDAVQIRIYPDTTSFLHQVFSIDGEGYVFLPIIGKQRIIGMSHSQFIGFLKNNYSPYLKTPNIQVRPLMRISALGGFARPDLYYIDPNATLWNLVHKAGGTRAENGLKKMKWERNKKTIASDLIPEYQSGKSLTQIGFRSGDQVWTPTPGKPTVWNKILPALGVAISLLNMYGWYLTIQLQTQRR
jgi:protein involved in polysaccharide export with SLBB domain